MLKRLSTIGSSKGLILDKTLLGLLGIEDDEEVSLKVEGRRLIVEPAFRNAIDEVRARLPEEQVGPAIDARVKAAAKKARTETVRRLRASRR